MSKKYIPVKCKSEGDDVWVGFYREVRVSSMDIIEEENIPHDTGLVDQYGNSFISIIERDQIGFVRREK